MFNRITAVMLIAFSGFLYWGIKDIPFKPGLFPKVLLLLLVILCLCLALRKKGKETLSIGNWKDVVFMTILMITYVVAISKINFFVSTILLLCIAFVFFNNGRKIFYHSILSIGIASVIYLIFKKLFGVPLP